VIPGGPCQPASQPARKAIVRVRDGSVREGVSVSPLSSLPPPMDGLGSGSGRGFKAQRPSRSCSIEVAWSSVSPLLGSPTSA